MNFFSNFDLVTFVKVVGYLGIFGMVFAESGLFLGFFLPGDSLLFTAGFLAFQGYFNILFLSLICFLGAVLGDSFGYAFGKKTGPKLFTMENSLIFKKSHLEKARAFYQAHGGKTIILARFMPIVRTFAPILAGVGMMKYSIFLFYNIIGGIAWVAGLLLSGYFLGNAIPGVDRYIIPIVAIIIFISILPLLIHIIKNKEYKR